jgi:hypothetical protein
VAQGCALVAGEQAFGSNQLWVQESDMTRSSRSSPPHASLDAEDAEAALQTFVAKFDVPHQRLIGEVRASLRRRFPAANELVYDNYNFFVIGYSPTDRPSLRRSALDRCVCQGGQSLLHPRRVPRRSGGTAARLGQADTLSARRLGQGARSSGRRATPCGRCGRGGGLAAGGAGRDSHHSVRVGQAARPSQIIEVARQRTSQERW